MTKNKGIVFIQKDRLEYYDEVQAKILQFVFQPTVVQDLEVADRDQLNIQLKSFLQNNKISTANLLFVISNSIIFEKSFPLSTAVNKETEVQKFLENIPFEQVIYKVIDRQKDYQVLAINKDLYSSFKLSFESLGSKVLGIIPLVSLGELYRNSQNLNSDIVKYTLSHFDQLQKQSFIQEEVNQVMQEVNPENAVDSSQFKNALNKYRTPILLSVFIFFLVILSVMMYYRYTPNLKANPVPSTIVGPTIIPPTTSNEETPESSPSAIPTEF